MTATRITRIDHLLVLLPYLLGYRPTDCLVLVGLRQGELGVIQRVDWPGPWGAYLPDDAWRMAGVLARDGCDEVCLVVHDDRPRRRRPALDRLGTVLERAGVGVVAVLAVLGKGGWIDIDCDDRACCPVEGRPLPAPEDVPAVASWVLRGVDPLPDRAAVTASVEPAAGMMTYDVAGRAPLRPSPAAARRAWACVLGVDGRDTPLDDLDPMVARRAVHAAGVPALRDEVLTVICPGMAEAAALARGAGRRRSRTDLSTVAPSAEGMLHRCTEFARRLPEPQRPDVLAMTAACAWWYGHGTLARVCVDRALDITPGHSLAELVARLLDEGVRPTRDCA